MIEKMDPNDYRYKTLVDKTNELIDAHNILEQNHNAHFHHARELQYGTDTPQYIIQETGENK